MTLAGDEKTLCDAMAQFVLPAGCTFLPGQLVAAAEPLVTLARAEDVPDADLADARMIIEGQRCGQASIRVRAEGVVAGGWLVALTASRYGRTLSVDVRVRDGGTVRAGETLAVIAGPVAEMVMAERVMLNFLSRLSGIATLTRQYVQAVDGTGAVITDTRKTTPGYRVLDKYAVQCGGGTNHRLNLCDGVMIKDNHISATRGSPIAPMVERVRASLRRQERNVPIWVEVDGLDQLPDALAGEPDIVLLDNMRVDQIRRAVTMRDEWFAKSSRTGARAHPLLEASGGIDLTNVADVARTGVDRIAVGAVTHSAPALDMGLDLDTAES